MSLVIYNDRGMRVRTLVDAMLPAGPQDRVWDGRDDGGASVASGVYLYRLTSGAERLVQKMALIR